MAGGEMRAEYVPGGLSPLSGWPGGKFYLCRRVIERMPAHFCYCEPFAGAAWVLFKKTPSRVECLNDVNDDVWNFFETVRTRSDELARRAEFVLHSRRQQRVFLEEPMPGWDEDAVERAFRFYYLIRVSYRGLRSRDASAPMSTGPTSKRIFSKSSFLRQIRAAHARLERVMLENLDWRRVLDLYDRPETFFYLDPPYPFTSVDYGRPWSLEDYQELAARLERLKGRFLLSLNDRPECRAIFASFNMEELRVRWGMSSRIKNFGELLFSNYSYGQQALQTGAAL